MKKTLITIIIGTLLSGCAITHVVNKKAEGEYVKYIPYEVSNTLLVDNKYIMLCFYGSYKRPFNKEQSQKSQIVQLLTLSNSEPFRASLYNSKPIDENCNTAITSLEAEHRTLDIYYIKKDLECIDNSSCNSINWEMSFNNNLIERGEVKKNKSYTSNSTFANDLFSSMSGNYGIYAIEDNRGGYEHYDLYYFNNNKNIPINLDSIFLEGNSAWYILTPFAVLADIITFPIQLIMGVNAVNEIGN